MKHLRWGILIFVVVSGIGARAAAEKFGTLGRDTLLSENPSFSAPTTIEMPKTAASPVPEAPVVPPTNSPADIDAVLFEPSKVPAIYNVNQPKITVPTFKMPEMLMPPQGQGLAMKKKTLLQTIGDEIMKFWLLIVLGIVVLLVIYAMRKNPGGSQAPHAATDQEAKKTDIWEKF